MSWATLPFPEVFADKTSGNVKTLQSDYLERGKFPIVDQGQQIVGGYTNDEERLCDVEGPVIVFGDHTKAFKFIDFPFCIGADGTKILKPKIDADMRYLFHAASQIHIPDNGYSRHFKYLKRGEIPLPPLEEQRRIAGILDQADALRRLRTRSLDTLNTLGQAIFHEMFGGFPTGEVLRDCPKLGEFLLDVKNGMTRRAKGSEEQNDVVLRLKDIRELEIDFSAVARISLDAKEKQKFSIEKGDLLFVRVNGNADYVGRNAVFHQFDEPVYFNDHIMRVRVAKERLIPQFLSFVLNSRFGKVQIAQNRKTSAGQHTINQDGLSKIRLPVPSLKQQREFVDALERIDSWRIRANASLSVSSDLFASLQHRAFRGEL